jgi:hypothetical protein
MRASRLLLLPAALLLVLADVPARGATLGLVTSASSVDVTQPLFVDVVIGDLGGAAVGDYDLDVLYDATRLSFTGVQFLGALGDPLASPLQVLQSQSGGAGVVDLAELSLLAPAALAALQGDPIVLARIGFTATAPGDVTFSIVDDIDLVVSDAFADPIALASPLGEATATVVPEPGTAALLALGLTVLCWSRRRA